MTWNRPHHLSDAEAAAWTQTEVERLAVLPGVDAIVLTRVTPTRPYARLADWVCELHVRTDPDACVAHPLCKEWLLDLRLLGMRPAVAILHEP